MSALDKVIRGVPGHPIHPPLTDATIGAYTVSTVLAVVGGLGISEDAAGKGMWLALVVGLCFSSITVVTGLVDYFTISGGTPLKRTATIHGLANGAASVFFVLATIFQYDGFRDGEVTAAGLVLTLIGFGFLTLGGWLGGSIVFVHGMRVLSLLEEPTRRAVTPGHPEKEEAEGAPKTPETGEPRDAAPTPAPGASLHDRPRDTPGG
jgi:uncharacterized membrane protein